MKYSSIVLIFILSSCGFTQEDQQGTKDHVQHANPIYIAGAMKNVMHAGKLEGFIDIDTISNREHLYGLGPIEGLKGEILIVDGVSYTSRYQTDTTAIIEQTYKVKAPFFGYTHINNWKELILPDSVTTIESIDQFLLGVTAKAEQPFFFKIRGRVVNAKVHIMNLPDGVQVTSPQVAHEQGQKHYTIQNENVTLIGFFSTEHQTIFTHHDTYTHIHLLTDDKKMMGHLEELTLSAGQQILYLPND